MDGQRVVIPLDPPANSKPGDRVFVEGFTHEQHGGIFLSFFFFFKIFLKKQNIKFKV